MVMGHSHTRVDQDDQKFSEWCNLSDQSKLQLTQKPILSQISASEEHFSVQATPYMALNVILDKNIRLQACFFIP